MRELTQRQKDILQLVQRGHTSREIADVLGVATSTIEASLAPIYRKLGVSGRRDLMARLYKEHEEGKSNA